MISMENIKFKIFASVNNVNFEKILKDMLKWFNKSEKFKYFVGDSISSNFMSNNRVYNIFMKRVDYKSALVVIGLVEEVNRYHDRIILSLSKHNENLNNSDDLECLDKLNEEYFDKDEECFYEDDTVEDEYREINDLRLLVKEYKYNSFSRILPKDPNGSLFGIGFIYDDDEDDRVLVAIRKLKHRENIIAIGERKGALTIYSKYPSNDPISELQVCGDYWCVDEYVFEDDTWVYCINEE